MSDSVAQASDSGAGSVVLSMMRASMVERPVVLA